jgi:hypothetical protein
MPRMQRMVGGAGDAWTPPPTTVCERAPVQHPRSTAPKDWPFPTYKGATLERPAQVTRKQRLNQLEDATW